MTDNIEVRANLTATDEASPVIKKLLANIKALERSARSFNRMENMGSKMFSDLSGLTDKLKQEVDRSIALNANSARQYSDIWRKAHRERLDSERSMHHAMRRFENNTRSRQQIILPPRQSSNGRYRQSDGYVAPRNSLPYGLVGTAGLAAGIKSSFNRRIITDTAETNLRMFGDFTKNEITKLRSEWANQAGIKYGLPTSEVIASFTEGVKAGVPKAFGKDFAEIILRSGTGLDLDFGETTKLAARTATIAGDLNSFNKTFITGFLNSVAVANKESAADANEIVESNKRAISALTSSKMSPNELSAFTASGISTGIQPGRAGTFMGFLVSELVNARNENGQRGGDLSQAARLLGFGNKSAMSSRMVANPTETLQEIFGKMSGMPEAQRTKIADLIGMREWRDETLAMVKVKDLIAKILKETKSNDSFLDQASAERLGSLSGKAKSSTSALLLMWENVGAGFEDVFTDISESVADLGRSMDPSSIKQRVQNLVRGIRDGFGLQSWNDAFTGVFGSTSLGNATKWSAAGKGIAEGLRLVWSSISTGMTFMGRLFGVDTADPRAMAKFATAFLGFAVVLRFLAPVVAVLATMATGIKAMFNGLLAIKGMFSSLSNVLVGGFRTILKGVVPAIALTLGNALLDIIFGAIDRLLDYVAPNRAKLDSQRIMDRSLIDNSSSPMWPRRPGRIPRITSTAKQVSAIRSVIMV